MGYKDFVSLVRKLNLNRKHKITNSYGVYDAYKWIRKNKWLNIGKALTEKLFYYIIRSINKRLSEQLSLGQDIKLPHRLGLLEVRKSPTKIAIKDGKIVTNMPIDWEATIKLWYLDEESYNNKTLVRKECSELYSIYYNKHNACYQNKSFFQFFPNRELRKALNKNVELNKLEAFLYYNG